MAKLYFYYSAMNAGKTTTLLQAAYNYRERGMRVQLIKPSTDTREKTTEITSRIGLSSPAIVLNPIDDITSHPDIDRGLDCILVDEAQFLSVNQVKELREIVDLWEVPVLCYGLRTDFKRDLFPGSQTLLAVADKLVELKGLCHCGRTARFVLRIDKVGNVVREGGQIEVGGNDRYSSVCSLHWRKGKANEEKAPNV